MFRGTISVTYTLEVPYFYDEETSPISEEDAVERGKHELYRLVDEAVRSVVQKAARKQRRDRFFRRLRSLGSDD